MLRSFCASFLCNFMPRSGCSALYGVNPNCKNNSNNIKQNNISNGAQSPIQPIIKTTKRAMRTGGWR